METVLDRARKGKNSRVWDVADYIGASKNGVYAAIKKGDIKVVRMGRAIFVPSHEVLRLCDAEAKAA